MLFIFAVLLLIASLWAIFFSTLPYHWCNYPDCHVSGLCLYQSLVTDSGYSLILISLVVMIEPLRMSFISRPAYKALADAMPSISPTEREALDSGTSWWERTLYGCAELGSL